MKWTPVGSISMKREKVKELEKNKVELEDYWKHLNSNSILEQAWKTHVPNK